GDGAGGTTRAIPAGGADLNAGRWKLDAIEPRHSRRGRPQASPARHGARRERTTDDGPCADVAARAAPAARVPERAVLARRPAPALGRRPGDRRPRAAADPRGLLPPRRTRP